MVRGLERLWAVAEDLHLERDACEQCEQDCGGDRADDGLHGGSAHKPQEIKHRAQVAEIGALVI